MRTMSRQGCVLLIVAVACFEHAVAGVYDAPLKQGARYLETQQSVDGSWQSAGSQARFLETAEATLALQMVNQRNLVYHSGITWLQNHNAGNTDYRARRLMALAQHSTNPQQDIQDIGASRKGEPGTNQGYGLSYFYEGSAWDSALSIQALQLVGAQPDPDKLAASLSFLKGEQRATAPLGWAATSGGNFDAMVTAHTVMALRLYSESDPTLVTPLNNGLDALKAQVTTSSSIRLRAIATLAYLRAKSATDTYATSMVNSLLTAQNATDGHWGSGVYDTALVMQALAVAAQRDLAAEREIIHMPDEQLRHAVNAQLGRNAMDQLNLGELKQLTTLHAANKGITDLTGLEHAINLTSADLSSNNITSVEPIADLPGFSQITLAGNPGYAPPVAQYPEPRTGDVPLPAWALLLLGGSMWGAAARVRRKR